MSARLFLRDLDLTVMTWIVEAIDRWLIEQHAPVPTWNRDVDRVDGAACGKCLNPWPCEGFNQAFADRERHRREREKNENEGGS